MGEKEHDGRHKGRLRRKAYVTGLSLAKATCGSWLKKWKGHCNAGPKLPPAGERVRTSFALTHVSDFRSASKASFETPGESTSLPLAMETSLRTPHPPPKGHACLISMRQHAAFGPPPWRGGSISEKSSSEAKTRRRAVLRIKDMLLNIIIAIIPQIEF